ncbi:hypothetical protein [Pseudacidovorax sp. NFM-22]|uniref:hypothetical protein n=1 Tax=Pseudacidovorax sp. NFM-22 TaxID=2744469 RepID=UPI001F180434|nr:hypothetical protein [Pseudacidovorax sp. NFM-22]
MTRWLNHCHFGNVRAAPRRRIEDALQVHTVTSTPYWGLRSHLPADHPDKLLEIGSKPIPRQLIGIDLNQTNDLLLPQPALLLESA